MGINKVSITVRGVIIYDGKFLLVRMPHNDFYCLPGGKLDYDEDVMVCLERELVEELGVKPQIGRLLYINNFLVKKEHCLDFIFEVLNGKDYLDLESKERTHAFELSKIIWIDKGQDIKVLPGQIKSDFDSAEILSDTVRFIK